jgi:hypothetical protein
MKKIMEIKKEELKKDYDEKKSIVCKWKFISMHAEKRKF